MTVLLYLQVANVLICVLIWALIGGLLLVACAKRCWRLACWAFTLPSNPWPSGLGRCKPAEPTLALTVEETEEVLAIRDRRDWLEKECRALVEKIGDVCGELRGLAEENESRAQTIKSQGELISEFRRVHQNIKSIPRDEEMRLRKAYDVLSQRNEKLSAENKAQACTIFELRGTIFELRVRYPTHVCPDGPS